MDITLKILQKVADNSNGKMKIVDVPDQMKPNAESMEKLKREIGSQLERNEVMLNKSIIKANDS